jgi:hypothetical protein
MSPATGPLGRPRSPFTAILLLVVTFGIYGLYWIYISFAELRAHRGEGVSGGVGLLLALVPVAIFLLPSYVGRMYADDGKQQPVSAITGLWALIPLLGSLIWLVKVQTALNQYWETKGARAAAAAPETTA